MRDHTQDEIRDAAWRYAVQHGSAVAAAAVWSAQNGLRNDLWAIDFSLALYGLERLEDGRAEAEARELRAVAKGAAIGWTQEGVDRVVARRAELAKACAASMKRAA